MSTPPTARPGVPRHWDTELGGIRWLPRLIDKARMKMRGELGAYLCGHSPVDQALLKRLDLTTDEFVAIVRANKTDEAVLDALRARKFDQIELNRWSARFHQSYAKLIPLWSLDEGYAQPKSGLQAFGYKVYKVFENPLMALYRKISPAP